MTLNKKLQLICEGKEFNEYQMEQIRMGLKDGLSMEQVQLYADPKFKDYQMKQIRKGLKEQLNTKNNRGKSALTLLIISCIWIGIVILITSIYALSQPYTLELLKLIENIAILSLIFPLILSIIGLCKAVNNRSFAQRRVAIILGIISISAIILLFVVFNLVTPRLNLDNLHHPLAGE